MILIKYYIKAYMEAYMGGYVGLYCGVYYGPIQYTPLILYHVGAVYNPPQIVYILYIRLIIFMGPYILYIIFRGPSFSLLSIYHYTINTVM